MEDNELDARKTQEGPLIVAMAKSNAQLSSVPERSPSRVTTEVVVAREATRHKGRGRHALATAAARAHSSAANSFPVMTCAMVPRLSSARTEA